MKTVVSVCSARPNFVKLAAVHHALTAHGGFRHVIVHTGQHYDPLLSDVFFTQLDIPQPDFNLGVKGASDREGVITATEEAIAPVLAEVRSDIVLVYGDVNGAVGAARAAKKAGIRIGHVEAGLRSGDLDMPEEHNRIEIDRLSDILFCSEQSGMDHLEKEGVPGERFLAGNTMIDTLLRMMPVIEGLPAPFAAAGDRFAVATLHRPSNVDRPEQLERVMHVINKAAAALPVVLPAHPRLLSALGRLEKTLPSGDVFLIEPLGYLQFIRLMMDAAFILTDSGGIQEEAVLLGKRCFTLRKNTERPSTILSGSNVLIDLEKDADRQQVFSFAANPAEVAVTVPEHWDGKTGGRIAEALEKRL